MVDYHQKYFYINTGNNSLTSSTGFKVDNPTFFYKDTMNLNWQINDVTGTGLNLTGGTFTFVLAGAFNGIPLLTVSDGTFIKTGIATGSISCVCDMNQGAIGTFVDLVASKSAYMALWCDLSGVTYCLINSQVTINNIIF